jgi:hypothetical protein
MCDDSYMRALVLGAAAAAIGAAAYQVQINDLHSPVNRAAATLAYGAAFLVAGLAAWSRRPGNKLGPLMVLTAFALLARQFRYSHDPAVFTLFFALGGLAYALVGHCVFAYPFGHVRGRAERSLVIAGYTAAVAFPVGVLLVFDGWPQLLQYSPLDPERRESLINVASSW